MSSGARSSSSRPGAPRAVWSTRPSRVRATAGSSEAADLVNTHYAGHTFRRVSGIDTHHEFVRYGWELVGPDGNPVIAGIDVGEVAPDGRLRKITGFFGDLPSLEQR